MPKIDPTNLKEEINFISLSKILYYDCLLKYDCLFGILVSTSDCHPRIPGLILGYRPYPRNFSGSIESGTGSTQPREDN